MKRYFSCIIFSYFPHFPCETKPLSATVSTINFTLFMISHLLYSVYWKHKECQRECGHCSRERICLTRVLAKQNSKIRWNMWNREYDFGNFKRLTQRKNDQDQFILKQSRIFPSEINISIWENIELDVNAMVVFQLCHHSWPISVYDEKKIIKVILSTTYFMLHIQ